MSNLALYRKYRSSDFSELIGQEHVTKSLETAIKEGRISHAYLFSGPRGVGKTSAARILARRINNLPADLPMDHLDIIEIDGASNRRIDEIRDLREKVHIAPTKGKYKIYVIDEVHMLTAEAFNALLKTLEEPPTHVVFILATTEPHKLPETIISRTQHFNFKPIKNDNIVTHLASIASSEDIQIGKEALSIIANISRGSFRDAISMLDQLPRNQLVSAEYINQMLGLPELEKIYELISSIINKDPKSTLATFDSFTATGVAPEYLHIKLLEILQYLIRCSLGVINFPDQFAALFHTLPTTKQLSSAATQLAILPGNSVAFGQLLETTLVELSLDLTKESQKLAEPATEKPLEQRRATPKTVSISSTKQADSSKSSALSKTHTGLNEDAWLKVLSQIKQKNPSLFGLLKTAETNFEGNNLNLNFRFQFHLKKFEEPSNRALLQASLKNITGAVINCEFGLVNPKPINESDFNTKPEAKDSEINTVLQILGGEVVNGN